MATARKVEGRKVRYGVVGLGWISQAAFMPGVAHTGNSEMTALVTGDEKKAQAFGKQYGIANTYHYDAYKSFLASGEVDAIYLALPNFQHREFAVPALEAGIHVLLEKPMAVSEEECRAIEQAAARSGAKLMIAYRLHFEPATLEALRLIRAGTLGEVRLFTSTFCQHVASTNHRARYGFWAGPVADMGPYPINAARMVFGAEPVEVQAWGTRKSGLSYNFDEIVAVTLRFPGDRLAQFTVGYGLNRLDEWAAVGDKGAIEMKPGFGFPGPLAFTLTEGDFEKRRSFPKVDQFGGETQYFSECILKDQHPEPDGEEGRLDVRVIAAVERALTTGRPVPLDPVQRHRRPAAEQVRELSVPHQPGLVRAAEPQEG